MILSYAMRSNVYLVVSERSRTMVNC